MRWTGSHASRLLTLGFIIVSGEGCASLLGLDDYRKGSAETVVAPPPESGDLNPNDPSVSGDDDASITAELSTVDAASDDVQGDAGADVGVEVAPGPNEAGVTTNVGEGVWMPEAQATVAEASVPESDATMGVPMPDASEGTSSGSADASCSTSAQVLGGDLLWSFDDFASTAGWVIGGAGSGTLGAKTGWTASDGHWCLGAATLQIPFRGFTTSLPDTEYVFATPAVWHATKLHAWVKLEVANDTAYESLRAVQLFLQSEAYARYSSVELAVNPTLSDGGWHEVVLDLLTPAMGPAVGTASVDKIGFAVATAGFQIGLAPSTTTLLLDDIWLE